MLRKKDTILSNIFVAATLLFTFGTICFLWWSGAIQEAPGQKSVLLVLLVAVAAYHFIRMCLSPWISNALFFASMVAGVLLSGAGLSGLAAVVLIILGSFSLGRIILSVAKAGEEPGIVSAEDSSILAELALPVFLGFSVLMPFTWFLLHLPINTSLTYVILYGGLVFWAYRRRLLRPLKEIWIEDQFFQKANTSIISFDSILTSIIQAHLLLLLCYCLFPEHMPDALILYSPFQAYVSEYGKWHFDLDRSMFAKSSFGFLYIHTTAFILGGEGASKTLPWVVTGLTTTLMFCLCQRHGNRKSALLASLLFLSTPLTTMLTTSIFFDLPTAGFCFAAWYSLFSTDRFSRGMQWACACCLAAALIVKISSLFLVIALAGVALVRLFKSGEPRPLRALLMAVLFVFILGVPPYLENYVSSGNPFLPNFSEYFPSRYTEGLVFVSPYPGMWAAPKIIWAYFFSTAQFMETENGTAGFQFLVCVPLALLLFFFIRPFYSLGLICVLALLVLQVKMDSNMRYLFHYVPLLSFFIGMSFYQVLSRIAPMNIEKKGRLFYKMISSMRSGALQTGVVILYLLNVAFMVNMSRGLLKQLPYESLSLESRDAFESSHGYMRRVCASLERSIDTRPNLLILNSSGCGPSYIPFQVFNWHNLGTYFPLLNAKSPDNVLSIIKNKLFTHVLIHDQTFFHNRQVIEPAVKGVGRVILDRNYFKLYELDIGKLDSQLSF